MDIVTEISEFYKWEDFSKEIDEKLKPVVELAARLTEPLSEGSYEPAEESFTL